MNYSIFQHKDRMSYLQQQDFFSTGSNCVAISAQVYNEVRRRLINDFLPTNVKIQHIAPKSGKPAESKVFIWHRSQEQGAYVLIDFVQDEPGMTVTLSDYDTLKVIYLPTTLISQSLHQAITSVVKKGFVPSDLGNL